MMERLTSRSELPYLKGTVLVRRKALGPAYFQNDDDYKDYRDALNRLAAYEDTGLEPEEIEDALSRFSELLCYLTNNHMSKTNYTMGAMLSEIEDVRQEACERYCDLKQAEQEGRLVVLPCKVGDTVYIVDRGKILEEEVLGFSTFNTKSGETVTAMTASYGYYVTRPNINDLGVLHSGNRLSFFFTREEAEKALKGVSEDA